MGFTALDTDDALPEEMNTLMAEIRAAIEQRLDVLTLSHPTWSITGGRADRWRDDLTQFRVQVFRLAGLTSSGVADIRTAKFVEDTTLYPEFSSGAALLVAAGISAAVWIDLTDNTKTYVSNPELSALFQQITDVLATLTIYRRYIRPIGTGSADPTDITPTHEYPSGSGQRFADSPIGAENAWDNCVADSISSTIDIYPGISGYLAWVGIVGWEYWIIGPNMTWSFDLTDCVGTCVDAHARWYLHEEFFFPTSAFSVDYGDSFGNTQTFDLGMGATTIFDITADIVCGAVNDIEISIQTPEPASKPFSPLSGGDATGIVAQYGVANYFYFDITSALTYG